MDTESSKRLSVAISQLLIRRDLAFILSKLANSAGVIVSSARQIDATDSVIGKRGRWRDGHTDEAKVGSGIIAIPVSSKIR